MDSAGTRKGYLTVSLEPHAVETESDLGENSGGLPAPPSCSYQTLVDLYGTLRGYPMVSLEPHEVETES